MRHAPDIDHQTESDVTPDATTTPDAGSGARHPAPEARKRVPPEVKQELVDNMKVLRAFAISLTRNGSRADDLVQDTVTKAWANIHSFQPGTNMRAWLFTILRNTFYSDRRKARREVADEEGQMSEQIARKPDHDGRLHMHDFRQAFQQLPDEQREVLILVGALQHSYEDAAEMCGVRVGTIKSRLNRGRARLAELMDLDETEALEITDRATQTVVSANGTSVA
jgi:RNA polymerase sigma-70 factor (ECF subfamily)